MKRCKQLLSILLAVVLLLAATPSAFAASGYATCGQVADLLVEAADDYNPGVQRSDILNSYPDSKLHEEDTVTRAQALIMLEQAFGTLPTPVGDNARSGYPASNFTDVPDKLRAQLSSVLSSGIVAGTSSTTLSPDAPMTVRQMELLIQRVYALKGTNLKDDFYATVNKKALDASVIRDGYTSADIFSDLDDQVAKDIASMIREVSAAPKTEGEKKIAALYNNALNTEARNKEGITPLKPYLDAISKASNVQELMQAHNSVYADLSSYTLMGFNLTIDSKDSNLYSLCFSPLYTLLDQGSYADATPAQKQAYLNYVTTVLQLLGESQQDAATHAQLLWDADARLAAQSLTAQELYDVDKTYNLFTMAQLQALFPNVNLSEVFGVTGLAQTDRILVWDVGLLKAGAALFDEAHLELLKEYCRLHLAQDFGYLLNQEFTEASDTFDQAYLGTSGTLTPEETAAQYVQSLMNDTLSQAYVARHFSASTKAEVEQMVRDILSVYKDRINALPWMSEATKAKAVRKLDTMQLQIGYPDTWSDILKDTPILSAAEGGSFFQNDVAIAQAYQRESVKEQQRNVDKTQWLMTPDTVNACYVSVFNSILFPAAILQPPFYDPNASYEENLGGIGYVIAHEITHAFDNNGAKYDENGNAANWWTEEDNAAFQALCQQVTELYDGQESAPGITCNGALTLSENIADLGAMACITQLEGRRENPDYRALYTAASQSWYSSCSRETKQYLAQNDVHAPDKLRGGLVLQQFQEFYDAFGITEGDGMYLAPADRVTIW